MRPLLRTALAAVLLLLILPESNAQAPSERVIYDSVGADFPAATPSIVRDQVVYQYDNGTGNVNIGPPSAFDPDMLWGNYFLTQEGGEVITEIWVAFGPTFPSLPDSPVTFWLLDDPDEDLSPLNATALTSVQGTPDVFGNTFFVVEIPPTEVSGAFFVGASAQLLGGQDRPARVDTSHSGNRSWFCYAPDISEVINDLASAPFCARMDGGDAPFPGAFMIRAIGEPAGTPEGCSVSPSELIFGDVIIGATADLSVTITNTGAGACEVGEVSITNDVFLTDFEGDVTLAADESVEVVVTFVPFEPVGEAGSLLIPLNGTQVDVELSGVGIAAPQASVDPESLVIAVMMGDSASEVVTLFNEADPGASLLEYSAAVLVPQGVMIDFEDGQSPPEFTLGNPADFVTTSGGNPGRYLRNNNLATFAPQLYIGPHEDSPFLGNYVERNVQAISADAITHSAPFGVAERPFSLVLTRYNNEPDNVEAWDYVYYTGPLAPQPGAGWSEYYFEIPSQYTGTLPEGWQGGYYGDPENLPEGVTFQDVISSVDQASLMWGHPAFFYLLQDFELGVDNVGIMLADEPAPGLSVDPEDGGIEPGNSEQLTVTVDASDMEEGYFYYDLVIETNDPERPVITVPVEIQVVTTSGEPGATPVSFALEQNYPNPFAASTTIEFALPEASTVTIEVFDLTGRRVATLLDTEMEAGYHRATWNANGVASGVYLYRIQAGTYSQTLRALVVR